VPYTGTDLASRARISAELADAHARLRARYEDWAKLQATLIAQLEERLASTIGWMLIGLTLGVCWYRTFTTDNTDVRQQGSVIWIICLVLASALAGYLYYRREQERERAEHAAALYKAHAAYQADAAALQAEIAAYTVALAAADDAAAQPL
jgi:hypothetical protein